jgi:hypothetical protein
MGRILSTLLLSLLVICAQQAALVHEMGHALGHGPEQAQTTIPGSGTQTPGTTEKGLYCDKCFQFAHVAGVAFAFSPAVFSLVADTESARDRAAADLAADAPPSRSRGPPIVL